MTHPRAYYYAALIIALATGIYCGFFLETKSISIPFSGSSQIREGGYTFIHPLLDGVAKNAFGEETEVSKTIAAAIEHEKAAGTINAAGAYFEDFSDGKWADVNNQNELFYPASLGKVPLMIAYLKLAESDPRILTETISYNDTYDANAQEEIPVHNPILPGHTYSVKELIERMIQYSDNNATEFLYGHIDQPTLKEVFSDLSIPMLQKNEPPRDFMTPKQYSLFLRVLYNSTYLSRASSEEALRLLSTTNFKEGIVAGIPTGVQIAHKYGLLTLAPQNVVRGRELHNCGIVYAPMHPYVLCIMTKSTAPLSAMEQAITNISRAVYQKVTGTNT